MRSSVQELGATDKTIQLPDGRILGYAEYGDLQGDPLLYFHGHPGSRYEARFLAGQAELQGIHLIGMDRPGMGLSTYQAGRRLLDWPDDVKVLANQLRLDRFSVVGFSGGGPYALACAYKIPERLIACGIVAGVGSLSPLLSFLSQWLPYLILPITNRFFRDEVQAQKNLIRFASKWEDADRKAFLQPGIQELMAASLVEASRSGSRGAAYDGALLGRSWGFQPEAIAFPNIFLWHGEQDTSIPIVTAQEVAKRIPNCTANYYAEGHISLIVNHQEDIIRTLKSAK